MIKQDAICDPGHSSTILVMLGAEERPFARLALNGIGIEAPQRGWRVDVLAMRAGPDRFWWKVRPALGHAMLHAALLSLRLARQAWPCRQPSQTALRHCGHMGGVLDTSSRVATIHAGQSDCPTFNGSLSGPVTFRTDPHVTAKLFGWHGAGL